MRSPGRGVKLTEDERHAWHHHLIAERKAAYDKLPARSGLDQYRRREASKRAWWTLTGHLRGEHGYGRNASAPFLAMTWAAVEAIHSRLHQESPANGPTPGNFSEPLDSDLHPGIE